VLGLFGDRSLPWALDDTDPERLHTLTKAIVPYLDADTDDSGYFLLLEASQIDWAGHGNDIASAMAEMHDLAKTMEYLVDYVEKHPDTLVILTADHSTGGLTIGAVSEYRWDAAFIKNFKKSIPSMALEINEQPDKGQYVSDMFGFALNNEEINSLSEINSNMSSRDIQAVLKAIVNTRTNTGWTTSGHTAVDVEVFAFGPGAHTDIADKIFTLLEKAH
jgi:alkaline phosphatase